MDSTRIACPLCGWWRTLDFGIDASGKQREVRFDKVNPATSILLRVERLHGHGREKGASEIQLIDAKGINGLDLKLIRQIQTQCHRILDVIEGRTAAKPEPFTPTPAKVIKKPGPAKETVTKKKPAAIKGRKPAAPVKEEPERKKPAKEEPEGIWDTYDTMTAAEIDRFKAAKRSPEFDWRIKENPKSKPADRYELWYLTKVQPVKEKPAAAKKPVVKKVTKNK
jgi:hypothetical protein